MNHLVHIWWQFQHFIGLDNVSGTAYAFYSGFGSVLLPALPVSGMYLYHNNCHKHGCWRLGRHKYQNGTYVFCSKHHPKIDESKL